MRSRAAIEADIARTQARLVALDLEAALCPADEPGLTPEAATEIVREVLSPKGKVTNALYKVRDPKTGLYSTGGYVPSLHSKGKTWTNVGHVKSSLRQAHKYRHSRHDITTWEVVEIRTVEMGARSVKDYL